MATQGTQIRSWPPTFSGGRWSARVLSTYIVEGSVSMLGIPIMMWESIPPQQYPGPFGTVKARVS